MSERVKICGVSKSTYPREFDIKESSSSDAYLDIFTASSILTSVGDWMK